MTPPEIQSIRDREHIRLLAIFHIIVGGLSLMFLPLLAMHYWVFKSIVIEGAFPGEFPAEFLPGGVQPSPAEPPSSDSFSTPPAPPQRAAVPFPAEIVPLLQWLYLIVGGLITAVSAANITSAFLMLKHKGRIFSIVMGGLNCLQVPFGTVLGVFTIIVLVRESVAALYHEKARASLAR